MKLYKEYFQKSKVFFYPLLDIPKGVHYVPVETYLACEDEYSFKDFKFFCLYDEKSTKRFENFEKKYLLGNKYFDDYQNIGPNLHLYIYDYNIYKRDWLALLRGKYSKFSKKSKDKILSFFGDTGSIAAYVESYIYPELYHEEYSIELDVSLEELQEVRELCSKPNLEKEILKIKSNQRELFNNKLVSLSNKPKIKKDGKKSNTKT